MKLMEEIVEFDQEIKMKQKWINSRIKMLHEIQKKHQKPEMQQITTEFLKKIQPEYPEKLSVEYKRAGDAIPMKMSDKYPFSIPLEMNKGDPIVLKSREDVQMERKISESHPLIEDVEEEK